MVPSPISEKALWRGLLDVLIRAGMIAVLAVFCFEVFHPFLNLMLWAVILAVTLYPLHLKLRSKMGNRDGRTATLIVMISIGLLIVPIYLVGVSMTESAQGAIATVKGGNFHVPPPPDSVASWPLIGKKVHGAWLQAANDLTGLAQHFKPQIKAFSLSMLGKFAGVGLGLLMFIGAMIIAGIIMAFGELGTRSALEIASRIFTPSRAAAITTLCTATIRAVAQGVVGIAFIQMFLVGIGFALMGVPGTGLLCLIVLLLGIVQVPATLVTIPVIVFVIATQGVSLATIVFSIYVFVAGLMDNVLKPLLLGRGVAVPMPVILIGAIGGMITNGIIGLFIGPVVLAVAYQLFWQWVRQPSHAVPDAVPPGNNLLESK
jgi:predicted PurR-regulated permease PerM